MQCLNLQLIKILWQIDCEDKGKNTYFSSIKDEPLFGPLTQRLVSALIEENIMTPMDDDMEDGASNGKLIEGQ